MARKRAYVAAVLHDDMVRYSGVEPIRIDGTDISYPGKSISWFMNNMPAAFVFVKPGSLNYNWVRNGVQRTRSFGIPACPGWWDGEKFTADYRPPATYKGLEEGKHL